jgi:hypothetical protein
LSKEKKEYHELAEYRSFVFSLSTLITIALFLASKAFELFNIDSESIEFLPTSIFFTYLAAFHLSKRLFLKVE